jgi:hypothetical protein
MLPFLLHQLTETNFHQICTEQWSETQTLEFKALLPSNEEVAKQEFRKDVCALANAEGGDLIYGISEKNGKANAIVPITGHNLDAVKRRLQQILESKVEPRIHGIQFHHCALAADEFLLILRIPMSYEGPHRFSILNEHRFPIRNDSLTSDMTYDQLRNAFGQGATLLEKAAQFRIDRVNKIAAGQTPRKLEPGVIMVLHIIPMCGMAGRADVDVASLHSDFTALKLDLDHSWLRAANLNGLVMYPYDDDSGIERCNQIFRNGAFEILMNISLLSQNGTGPTDIVGQWIGEELRNGLKTYATAAPQLGVLGPVVISISLTNTAGTLLATSNRRSTKQPMIENRLDLPEVMIDDIASPLDLDDAMRPIMDVLYQSYGQARCTLFDNDGKWCPTR